MSTWQVWQPAFDRVTLRDDGDPLEIRAAVEHGLDVMFQNYVAFWRYHIVPATNRPANLDLRQEAAREIGQIAELSHSLLGDLVQAADSLVRIRVGDLGGDRFRNCTDAIKCDGDAIQKFTDLQKRIEALTAVVHRPIQVWSDADWRARWFPSREKIISYRNFLTHTGQPQVMLVPQNGGSMVPYVLHQDYVIRGQHLTWAEQKKVYRTSPEKFTTLANACEELHIESIAWLNDAYGEVIRALQPLLSDDNYHWLWGWDTQSRGRHVWQQAGAMGAQAPIGSGTSVVGFVPGSGQGSP
ncbi:MAG: hypothetical protein NT171_16700 [Planctomycetota bacterium]|nr:hypothetical protein [Planctomycetota bacterium]